MKIQLDLNLTKQQCELIEKLISIDHVFPQHDSDILDILSNFDLEDILKLESFPTKFGSIQLLEISRSDNFIVAFCLTTISKFIAYELKTNLIG